MFRAKILEEISDFQEDPVFIIGYYKIFELLGYADPQEENLCKEQLNIIRSKLSPTLYKYAETIAEKEAKFAVKKYSFGNNGLVFRNYKFI